MSKSEHAKAAGKGKSNKKKVRLSDQQLQVVQALNLLGSAGAKQVQQQLAHLNLAHTTVATVLSRLEKKGILASEVVGRERLYHSLVDESDIRQSMVDSLITTVFKGDPNALMAHLLNEEDIDPDELEALQDKLNRRRRDD